MTTTLEPIDEDAYLELKFSPNARLVPSVRRFASEFYAYVLASPDLTSQLAVATHELLDNAVRYSLDGDTSLRLGIRRLARSFQVTIHTRNRAHVDAIALMRKALDELAAAPDADAHYQTLMRRSAKLLGRSGLGLVRVRAESGMALSYEVDSDTVHVRALADYDAVPPGAKSC